MLTIVSYAQMYAKMHRHEMQNNTWTKMPRLRHQYNKVLYLLKKNHFSLIDLRIKIKGIYIIKYCICIYPTPPHGHAVIQGQFLKWIKLVAKPRLKNQYARLFTCSWREKSLILAFPKNISAKWNTLSRIWTQITNSISCNDKHYINCA